MTINHTFSIALQIKIDILKKRRSPIRIGSVNFSSPLLLAPMSGLCKSPYRLLMEELGCGGTVSELVSCHGINNNNEKTKRMLHIDKKEANIGLQLFGEDAASIAKAAITVQEYGPKFIDINMGCPVRKVVTKGGGSALLRDTKQLSNFFSTIKKEIELPLTIKIRTGWDSESINAQEVIHIAKEEGIDFVAVHGRTREQGYEGRADWSLLENIAKESLLPIIGNGDLHTASKVRQTMKKTNCNALMLGRGALRNPFIFLESYLTDNDKIHFNANDYLEVTQRYLTLLKEHSDHRRRTLITMKKNIIWIATGYPCVAEFRNKIFASPDINETMKITTDFFSEIGSELKQIDHTKDFMNGGHG